MRREFVPFRRFTIPKCSSAELSTSSADAKTLILRISEPGEVLGLPATVTGKSYELTADIIEPAQANFIARNDFLNFLRDNGEAALRVAQQPGETYHLAISEMLTIGLSHSASEKLARFLLEWAANCPEEKGQVRIKMTLTHEEIAQMIGSSRNGHSASSPIFAASSSLEVVGSILILRSKADLEAIING
jgi:CRP/FNR family transcriptional regulator, cyclic AMP receptor protein